MLFNPTASVQVSEIHAGEKKIVMIDDVLKIRTNK
jgi:hypothetical protein